MTKTKSADLNDQFLKALNDKFSKQKQLIEVVGNILKIERESAYRRVKGIVQFSIRDMGLLAKNLNISLDGLMYDDEQTNVVRLHLLSPRKEESLENKAPKIGEYLEKIKAVIDYPDGEMGAIYTQLPTEFTIPYPNLFKFMSYKWGLYDVGPEACRDFTHWKVPEDIIHYNPNVLSAYNNIKKIIYIWDKAIISDLLNDLKFFASAGILNTDDVNNIKEEIHIMLNDLEKLVAAGGTKDNPDGMEFYISHFKIGITYMYLWSREYRASFITTLPILSTINENKTTCENVRNWIKSLKKVSTLISGTGDKERILFFKEQRQIVDNFTGQQNNLNIL